MHALFNTMVGRACISRLVDRAHREGLTIKEFGAAYRCERGWGDPSVASLVELWAAGDNPEAYEAARQLLNCRMRDAVAAGDWRPAATSQIEGFPDEVRFQPVTDKGREMAALVRSESSRLRLQEDQWYALRAQGLTA